MRTAMRRNWIIFTAAVLCAAALLVTGCKDEYIGGGDPNVPPNVLPNEPEQELLDIFVLDISRETDWDYLVGGKDGSSIFLNVDGSNDIPTSLFLRPDRNSDAGFTYLFKENGLLDKVIANGHILYFGNFNGYTFDLAVIYPNNTIEYFYDIQTETNWDAYDGRAMSGQGRSLFSGIINSLGFVSHAIGIGSCVAGFFFTPALGACATYVAAEVGHAVIDKVFDGFAADVGHTIINIFGCAEGGAIDCVSGLARSADLLSYLDFNLTEQKAQEIAQAIGQIDGGRGDVKVTLTWNNLADIDLHVIDPSGERIYYNHPYSSSGGELDFDNRYGYGPENIYWPAWGAPSGTYEVYVHFYDTGTSSASNYSSEFMVVITAFGSVQVYTGEVAYDGTYVYVASFNSNGEIYSGSPMSRSISKRDWDLPRHDKSASVAGPTAELD